MREKPLDALWHKRCSIAPNNCQIKNSGTRKVVQDNDGYEKGLRILNEKSDIGAGTEDINSLKTMSIRIKFEAPLVGWSRLIAVALVQSCVATAGSLQGTSPVPSQPEAVDQIVWGAVTPPIEKPPSEANGLKPLPAVSRKRNVGEASWYGPGFRGKKTASGEIFDDQKFTAAHKTLPLGTKAKVTNLDNQKSVDVEINDRGPYVNGRIIDLSRAAAKALDMVEQGTAEVQIELLDDEVLAEESERSSSRRLTRDVGTES
jgi:peptidoglycan lytic transglycosylase